MASNDQTEGFDLGTAMGGGGTSSQRPMRPLNDWRWDEVPEREKWSATWGVLWRVWVVQAVALIFLLGLATLLAGF